MRKKGQPFLVYVILAILTPFFIMGGLVLVTGTAIKSIGYLLCFNVDDAAEQWLDVYEEVKRFRFLP